MLTLLDLGSVRASSAQELLSLNQIPQTHTGRGVCTLRSGKHNPRTMGSEAVAFANDRRCWDSEGVAWPGDGEGKGEGGVVYVPPTPPPQHPPSSPSLCSWCCFPSLSIPCCRNPLGSGSVWLGGRWVRNTWNQKRQALPGCVDGQALSWDLRQDFLSHDDVTAVAAPPVAGPHEMCCGRKIHALFKDVVCRKTM